MVNLNAVRLLSFLRRIEYVGSSCPDCGMLFRKRAHCSDCTLAQYLRDLEEVVNDG